MEVLVSPQTQKLNSQTPRKSSIIGYQRDLWLAVREGIVIDVDSALGLLKKNGGNVNLRYVCGLTPLHIATWRNHIPIVRRLLAAGADPDARWLQRFSVGEVVRTINWELAINIFISYLARSTHCMGVI